MTCGITFSRLRHDIAAASGLVALSVGALMAGNAVHAQTTPDPNAQITIEATGAPDAATAAAAPDASPFLCPTRQLKVPSGAKALVVDVGCLSWGPGGFADVQWTSSIVGVYMHEKLILQSDGNFVFHDYSNNKTWGARTRLADNPNGPGTSANFQTDANLVVRNVLGTAIWASNTHTFPNAILAFQDDGNLVIYDDDSNFKALWATNTR